MQTAGYSELLPRTNVDFQETEAFFGDIFRRHDRFSVNSRPESKVGMTGSIITLLVPFQMMSWGPINNPHIIIVKMVQKSHFQETSNKLHFSETKNTL